MTNEEKLQLRDIALSSCLMVLEDLVCAKAYLEGGCNNKLYDECIQEIADFENEWAKKEDKEKCL